MRSAFPILTEERETNKIAEEEGAIERVHEHFVSTHLFETEVVRVSKSSMAPSSGKIANDFLIPVIPVDVNAAHKQRTVDFGKEENAKKFMRRNRWFELDLGGVRAFRCNWVVFLFSSLFLWFFVILVLAVDKEDGNPALEEFGKWMTWIAQNFAWLYIATQVRRRVASINTTLFLLYALCHENDQDFVHNVVHHDDGGCIVRSM
jgi:hypothetical protein